MGILRIATEDKLHSAESATELPGVKASTTGMTKVLDNHTDAIAIHVSNELRKLNR